jgi:lincosamide nucleotidyltransferase A/C/D/E
LEKCFVKLPSMQLESVLALCRTFEAANLDFWIDGGWGVDALLGLQTRPHSDLDLAVHFADLSRFQNALLPLGYQPVVRSENPAWNLVFRHPVDGSVDLHSFVLNDVGEGILGDPSENSMHPTGALDGVGRLGIMQVRCIAALFVLTFRNGFEPRDVDRHDVAALCEHFGLKRPSRFWHQ